MMASLVGILASPAVRSVSETDTKGKQFLRLGPLYSAVGWWLYQQGGILGYSLKGERQLVEKIINLATHHPIEDVDIYRDTIIADLENVKNHEKHLTWLYTYLETEKIGIDITDQKDKQILEKMDMKFCREVMKEAFYKGVTIGFHFPDVFREYWMNTYQKVFEDKLGQDSKRNPAPSKGQAELAFGEAVKKVINTIFNWNELEGYEVLNREDESTLESILSNCNKDKSPTN